MSDRVAMALATLSWLCAMFVPLEWAFPAWRGQKRLRAGWLADLGFFLGQHLVFSAAVVTAIHWAFPSLEALAGVRSSFGELPLVVRAIVVIALGDFVAYWAHRAQHRFEWLWRFHAVHHTSTHLDFLAAHREHPLDGLYTQTMVNLPALLLGLSLHQLLGLVAFRSIWAIFIHSNVRIPLGPLRMLLGAPELHHWHHAKERLAGNYANLAPYLDWLFGSYERPASEPEVLGIEEPHPESYFGLLLYPFVRRETAVMIENDHALALDPDLRDSGVLATSEGDAAG